MAVHIEITVVCKLDGKKILKRKTLVQDGDIVTVNLTTTQPQVKGDLTAPA